MNWTADAYSATGGAWQRGPGPIYDRLARMLVACSPVCLHGRLALDVGSGTGAAARALTAAGAKVVASDIALGMLAFDRANRCPSVTADARGLPFADRVFDAVVSAFSLNHLPEPAVGLREAARVAIPGGLVLASSYAHSDAHPVKQAVEQALTEVGWTPPDGYAELRAAASLLTTAAALESSASCAGLQVVRIEELTCDFADLGPSGLIEWRLGTAQHAPFVARLQPAVRAQVCARAAELLGPRPPVLRREFLVLVARTVR